LKDHNGVLEKSKEEYDILNKELSELEKGNNSIDIKSYHTVNPLTDFDEKNKLFDSYNILNDKYKFGVHKIIEKDLKEKERVKKFMIETDDEIHLEMDTLDPITLRKN